MEGKRKLLVTYLLATTSLRLCKHDGLIMTSSMLLLLYFSYQYLGIVHFTCLNTYLAPTHPGPPPHHHLPFLRCLLMFSLVQFGGWVSVLFYPTPPTHSRLFFLFMMPVVIYKVLSIDHHLHIHTYKKLNKNGAIDDATNTINSDVTFSRHMCTMYI